MDRLWAPWRAQYILDAAQSPEPRGGCFLCDGLAAGPGHDRENLVVWRGPDSVVFLNRFPYNNGHLLVCPLVHKGTLEELSEAELVGPIRTVRRMVSALDRLMSPQGYNVGLNLGRSAGAGLPGHLHWHVVPRWDGDTNFMPVLGNAKVIVESLDAFRDRLAEILGSESD